MLLLIPILMVFAGFMLRLGMGLVYGVRGPEPGDPVYLGGQIISWGLLGGGLLVWSLLPLAGSVVAFAVCVMLWVLIGFAVVDAVRSTRSMHRQAVGKLLAVSLREGQLPQAVDLLSQHSAGWFVGGAATQLAYDLHSGEPLYESVVRHKAALPREAAAYAAIGTLTSAEPDALDELSRPDNPQLASAWRWWFDNFAYTVALVLTMSILLALFAMYIIPQFRDIFWEFDLALPPMTDVAIGAADEPILWGLIVVGTLFALITMFVVGVFYLLDLPVLGGITDLVFHRVHAAEALRMLALAIEHRAELPRALYAISVTHPVRMVRSRLSASYQDVASGQPWPDVLMHNRLLSRNEKGLVETAEAVGNLPWALRQIAYRREAQLAARMTVIGNLAHPVMILGISLFVGFICVALFIPIVKLIEGLS